MRLHTLPFVLFALLVLGSTNAAAERIHHYRVEIDADLSALSVHGCFAGTSPARLVAASLDASLALERAQRIGNPKRLEANGTELPLGAPGEDVCVDYRVNLLDFAGRHQHGGNPTRRIGGDLITDIGLWLWRPETLAADEDVEVAFALPDGVSVSVPWQPVAERTYRIGHSPYDWPGTVAFGHFTEQNVTVPGATLHIALLDARRVDAAQMVEWLRRAAQSVTSLYGRFPVSSLQVVVVPNARSPGPVPSAYVLRGGGPGAHFFVNQRRPIEEFFADWSAVHELSHLFLPYVDADDAWLSEGVASYYQNVLRARSGTMATDAAWQAMHSSFERGRADGAGSLATATQRMYRNGEFMRVYWGGAALMLIADERLRSRSEGRYSLDSVLDQLQRCCLAGDVPWHAEDLFRRMDALAGDSTVFKDLYAEQSRSERFPDLSEAYRLLGLHAESGTLVIDADAPRKADRDAIMRGPATEATAR